MEDNILTLEQIHLYLLQNGGKVRNRDVVRHFKSFLTDPVTKDENRCRFKSYINTLALTKSEGDEKVIQLKAKFSSYDPPAATYREVYSPTLDPINSIGIPVTPTDLNLVSPRGTAKNTPPKSQLAGNRPPPYRPPPPVYSSTTSLDSLSLGSMVSLNELALTPQAPPRDRRKDSEKSRSISEESTPKKSDGDANFDDKTVSVKERTQKFNRLASVEDELSPRQPKSAEKENRRPNWGPDQDDGLNLTPLEPKKCMEWYVTASRGDYQELLKLANNEPRLVSKKDPFTTVLHWGAKYGNPDIIKAFAGKYKVDVNGKTGYTPLHISAQFGHKDVFKLLIEVYKADPGMRDYSGRTADYYFLAKEQKQGQIVTMRKIKGRKKQSDKEGFLRIGSLNVRVKKTTEAFSNFLGVGSGASVTPLDSVDEKLLKGWGSVDNVNKEGTLKNYGTKKKSKKSFDSGGSSTSTPGTPKTPIKMFNSMHCNDSDSDTAAGFDSNWKN